MNWAQQQIGQLINARERRVDVLERDTTLDASVKKALLLENRRFIMILQSMLAEGTIGESTDNDMPLEGEIFG